MSPEEPIAKRPTVDTPFALLARIGYIVVVLAATLSDLGFDANTGPVRDRLTRAFDLTLHMHDAVDAARNIVLFAGLGAVWIITSRTGRLRRSTLHVTLLGCALGFFSETLQLFSPIRHASIIDVTTNTIGALVGALLVDATITWMESDRERPSIIGIPAIIFALTYTLSVMMETFTPLFRPATIPDLGGNVAVRIGRAVDAFQTTSITDFPVIDFVLFLPAGIFAVAALFEFGIGKRTAWLGTAIVGTVVCATIEVAHGVVNHPIQLGAILSHASAIAIGAWIASRWLPVLSHKGSDTIRVRWLFIVYCALIMLWSWRPFTPELNAQSIDEQFSAEHWIPLRALAVRFDLFTVTDVMTQFALYLPLGALLAVWPLRKSGTWRHLLPAVYLSLVMELGKIIVAQRFFDVTHILIQVAGAAIGWAGTRDAGYGVLGEVWSE